jgi:hypothetical protein
VAALDPDQALRPASRVLSDFTDRTMIRTIRFACQDSHRGHLMMIDRPEPRLPAASGQPRGIGQRIAFGLALLFYAGALSCAVALGVWLTPLGVEHPVIASLAASIVFFIGGGIVLHVIGRANLPRLRPHA